MGHYEYDDALCSWWLRESRVEWRRHSSVKWLSIKGTKGDRDAKEAAAAACDVVGASSIRKWIELLYFTLHILFPFVDDVKQPCTHNMPDKKNYDRCAFLWPTIYNQNSLSWCTIWRHHSAVVVVADSTWTFVPMRTTNYRGSPIPKNHLIALLDLIYIL